ncbi:MAG TPA: GNAT family N-acyltransferase [Bryobacteraceae bacterium]|nr:GNAT family N-acyltransferase [Bryobacteraceae bacterium]
MDADTRTIPVSLAPILPPALRKWTLPIEPALRRLLIPNRVACAMEAAPRSGGADFCRGILEYLNIRFDASAADLRRIPAKGSVIAVSNHPFGIVEGLVLSVILERARPDWKILANSMLSGLGDLRPHLVSVNPFGGAVKQNVAPMRESLDWVASGGLLALFPGGEVASLNWQEQPVADPPWKDTAARLAIRSRCPVIPMYFEGSNSLSFQVAGTLHPSLRTLSLARELEKLSGKAVRLRIGNLIPSSLLAAYSDAATATRYLRSRTYFLAKRSEPKPIPPVSTTPVRTVAPADVERRLSEEVAALPPSFRLTANTEFSVYLAPAGAIPRILQEIGRCREIAFQAVGEGSGRASDLDDFDRHYQHLFLWSEKDSRLVGAYRLAVTSDVLPRFGVAGLYTSTLFRFDPRLFDATGPAVELGRSFVMPDYQKNYASLLLLWKGITRAIQRRPEAPLLFGAVSISNQYQAASRSLMVTYLSSRAGHELARFVQPRRPFRHRTLRDGQVRRIAGVAADIEGVSLSIADIEPDAKGVPVLLRQYLKAGGRLLGFNLDPEFSDVLDALIIADLRTASPALLQRCMGAAEARAFFAFYGRSEGSLTLC